MENKLQGSMEAGKKTVGTFLSFANADFAECIGLAGLDYVIVDTEHGPNDVEQTVSLLRASESRGATALVRVKDSSRSSILKMLDIGAKGLVIPNIRSIEEVKEIIKYGKYHPLGQRGFTTARAAGYGFADYSADIEEYMDLSNKKTMLIPQCETLESLAAIEEIASLAGVDGIFVGPFDLSQAMGKMGQFDSEEFQEALERILKACHAAEIPAFIFATTPGMAKKYFQMGFDSVALSIDIWVFTNAYKDLLKKTLE